MVKRLLLSLVILLCLAGQSFTASSNDGIISPSNNSTLGNAWTYFKIYPTDDTYVNCYVLDIGTERGSWDIAHVGVPRETEDKLSDGSVYTLVTGIPLTGQPIYVKFSYYGIHPADPYRENPNRPYPQLDSWNEKYYTYNTIQTPQIILPGSEDVGSTELGSKVQFCWKPNGVQVDRWALTVDRYQLDPLSGSKTFGSRYYHSGAKYGSSATNSLIADGLPTHGFSANQYLVATISYARRNVSYLYKPGRRRYMVSPTPGSTLYNFSNYTLSWNDDGQPLGYTYVSIGYSPGGTEIQPETSAGYFGYSTSMSFRLPNTANRDIYVRTKTRTWDYLRMKFKWEYTDTLYKTFNKFTMYPYPYSNHLPR